MKGLFFASFSRFSLLTRLRPKAILWPESLVIKAAAYEYLLNHTHRWRGSHWR